MSTVLALAWQATPLSLLFHTQWKRENHDWPFCLLGGGLPLATLLSALYSLAHSLIHSLTLCVGLFRWTDSALLLAARVATAWAHIFAFSLSSALIAAAVCVCVHCTALHFPDSRSSVWIFFINQLSLPSSSVHSCCCCWKAKGARAIYLISSLLFLVAVVKESERAKNLPYARHRGCCCYHCGFVSVTKLLLLLFCSSLVGRSVIIVRWCLIFYVSLELKQQQLSGSQLSS